MNDQTKCPKCGEEPFTKSDMYVMLMGESKGQEWFCGSKERNGKFEQSTDCKLCQQAVLLAECVGVMERMQKLLKRVATPDASSGYQYLDLGAKDDAWDFIKSKTLAALKQRIAVLKG